MGAARGGRHARREDDVETRFIVEPVSGARKTYFELEELGADSARRNRPQEQVGVVFCRNSRLGSPRAH